MRRRPIGEVRKVIDDLRREDPHPVIDDWPHQVLDFDEDVPEPEQGSGRIQWKGTDVCMDVHCRCGARMHFDTDFLYFVRCTACRTTFAVGSVVRLYAVDDAYAARHGIDKRAKVSENTCTSNSTVAEGPCSCARCFP